MLARRLTGKYIAPETEDLTNRVKEIQEGTYDDSMKELMIKSIDELKELYNTRDITK